MAEIRRQQREPSPCVMTVAVRVKHGTDRETVAALTSLPQTHFRPERYLLKEPLSPHRAAELVHAGVDVGRVSQLTYENYPRRRVELLRALLGTMRFDANDRVASFSLSLASAKRLGVLPEDNEGLIDHLRAIHGVSVAVFFEELADGKVRVSMRSKTEKVNVCAICEKFGGGGHVLAAGARVRGSLAEVEKKILEEVCNVVGLNS